MEKCKANTIQADLGLFTQIRAYLEPWYFHTYLGIIRHIQQLLRHI